VNATSDRGIICTLPADPRSVAEARRAITAACQLAGFPAERCDQLVLLTSELVTNAVLYGRSSVRLTISWSDAGMRVEVGDDNTREPVVRSADPAAIDGRGMSLVNELADNWGVAHDDHGKRVWFEMRAGSASSDR
jgi:anti-sigma regulatory factor (Ser/Thr protein kinase)